LWCFLSNDTTRGFEKLMRFEIFFFSFSFYDFLILNYFFKKIDFVVIFNLFHIGISRSHNLNHKFCMPFFNRVFLKKISCLYLFFEEFVFIQMSFIL